MNGEETCFRILTDAVLQFLMPILCRYISTFSPPDHYILIQFLRHSSFLIQFSHNCLKIEPYSFIYVTSLESRFCCVWIYIISHLEFSALLIGIRRFLYLGDTMCFFLRIHRISCLVSLPDDIEYRRSSNIGTTTVWSFNIYRKTNFNFDDYNPGCDIEKVLLCISLLFMMFPIP